MSGASSKTYQQARAAELRITGLLHCGYCHSMQRADTFAPKKPGKPPCCGNCHSVRQQRIANLRSTPCA